MTAVPLRAMPDLSEPIEGEERIAWIETLISVLDPTLRVPVKLVPNAMQRDIIETLTDREITLKSRRAGLTSIYVADAWIDVLTKPGTKVELIAHTQELAEQIFEQVVRYQFERIPDFMKPTATTDTVREFRFKKLDSSFRVTTAGQSSDVAMKKGQGRTISHLLLTEFAFYAYPEDLFSKIINCVPEIGGKVRIDSTPNGQGSFYRRFREARDGVGDYLARFYPWYWDARNWRTVPDGVEIGEPTEQEIDDLAKHVARYRNPYAGEGEVVDGLGLTREQLYWRRQKIANLQPKGALTSRDVFVVEYPEDEQSCFLHSGRPLFLARDLQQRAELREAEPGHWHAIGHDASTGDASGHPAGTAVIDLETGEQVYEWRGWEPVDSQAERLVELQRRYPGIIVPERNYPGEAVLALLRRWNVANVYKHRDKELREGIGVKAYKRKPGFPVSDRTKPRLFSELEHGISRKELKLAGKKTLDDLKGFQYNDDDRIEFLGSAEHHREVGELSHGELGIAIALAWWGRKVGAVGVG